MESEILKEKLQQIYALHEPDYRSYVWVSEADRWAELVFCLLNEITAMDPQQVRAAVSFLQDLDLLGIEVLAGSSKQSREASIVIAYILERFGFTHPEAQGAVKLLVGVAKAVQKEYAGKIQIFLRRYGKMMQDELVEILKGDALEEPELRSAVTLWLQNALSLPVSLESPAVVDFCEQNGVQPEELWNAADSLDLNLALVDDLIQMAHNSPDLDISEVLEGEQ